LQTYLLGPVLSMLPLRWRTALFPTADIHWTQATLVSGLLFGVGCLVGLVVGYFQYFMAVVEQQAAAASDALTRTGQMPQGMTNVHVGYGMGLGGLLMFAGHPLTIVLAYFTADGFYRMMAALVTGEAPGTGPLALTDWLARIWQRRVYEKRVPLVRDKVTADPEGREWNLKVESCRPKPNWKYPLTVKYGEEFFCVLGHSTAGNEARPHVYLLRRVPAGEAYRGMEVYDPGDVLKPGPPTLAQVTVRALRDGFRVKTLPLVADTVERSVEEAGVFLLISSCRPKAEWGVGRLVRFEECFYRVEEVFEADPPRPFCFRLRLLPAGLAGRRVIDYHTDDVLKQPKT
jgi:hypothetical protein